MTQKSESQGSIESSANQVESADQQRAKVLKEINFYFRHPSLTEDDRLAVVEGLKTLLDGLKSKV